MESEVFDEDAYPVSDDDDDGPPSLIGSSEDEDDEYQRPVKKRQQNVGAWEAPAKSYSHMNLKEDANKGQQQLDKATQSAMDERRRLKNAKKRADKRRRQKERKLREGAAAASDDEDDDDDDESVAGHAAEVSDDIPRDTSGNPIPLDVDHTTKYVFISFFKSCSFFFLLLSW